MRQNSRQIVPDSQNKSPDSPQKKRLSLVCHDKTEVPLTQRLTFRKSFRRRNGIMQGDDGEITGKPFSSCAYHKQLERLWEARKVHMEDYDELTHNLEVEAKKYYYGEILRNHGHLLKKPMFKKIKSRYNRYVCESKGNDLFKSTESSGDEKKEDNDDLMLKQRTESELGNFKVMDPANMDEFNFMDYKVRITKSKVMEKLRANISEHMKLARRKSKIQLSQPSFKLRKGSKISSMRTSPKSGTESNMISAATSFANTIAKPSLPISKRDNQNSINIYLDK